MRRTRILCTVGPASDSPEQIRKLIDAGADAFRLNFSHGTHDTHARSLRNIRSAATDSGRQIGILQDLSGPKIRIGELVAPITLAPGDALVIEHGKFAGTAPRVSCSFDALFSSVPAGARLLLDDGRIEIEVTRASDKRLETRVMTGGVLESHKGINVPGVRLGTSALTAKDAADLDAGLKLGVDLVAVSFVQAAQDIRDVRAHAGSADVSIVAKIEKPQALEALDEILDECDGVMVARGDLGIEIPLEAVPAAQKRVVLGARERGIPVIVATQVLESMRNAPRPTRAEVTDAAHAVDEGADAIMLAGETAIGQYPILAVSTLDRILVEAERHRPLDANIAHAAARWVPHGRALCEAAVTLATRAGAEAIVALTEGGRTARILSALRPNARILATTANTSAASRLSLVWGVTPILTPTTTVAEVRDVLCNQSLVAAGTSVVFVAMGQALDREDSNFVHVEQL